MSLEHSDEEFIAKFAKLSSSESFAERNIILSQHTIKKRVWDRCIIAKVISNKVVQEEAFSQVMAGVWKTHPATTFEALGDNHFIIELEQETDMFRILSKGLWNLRGDMVVTRHAYGPEDNTNPEVTHMNCVVELHGVPPETISIEGVRDMMKQVGTPVSALQGNFYARQKVYKHTLRINMSEELIDKVSFTHPEKGKIEVKVVYDGVTLVCLFCAKIGHDTTTCLLEAERLGLSNRERWMKFLEMNRYQMQE